MNLLVDCVGPGALGGEDDVSVEEDDVDAGGGDAGAVAVAGERRLFDLPAAAFLALKKPVQLQIVLPNIWKTVNAVN